LDRKPKLVQEEIILDALERSWSPRSSTQWTKDNPARGQCGVTALVVQDRFGGEILKTRLADGRWHYYNRIEGRRYDFTAGQFPEPVANDDSISNREEALSDADDGQYRHLSEEFKKRLERDIS
jgi:hypothetical protein